MFPSLPMNDADFIFSLVSSRFHLFTFRFHLLLSQTFLLSLASDFSSLTFRFRKPFPLSPSDHHPFSNMHHLSTVNPCSVLHCPSPSTVLSLFSPFNLQLLRTGLFRLLATGEGRCSLSRQSLMLIWKILETLKHLKVILFIRIWKPSSQSQSPSFNTPNSTRFRPFGSEPIIPFYRKLRLWSLQGSKSVKRRKNFVLEATNMTISGDSLLNGMDEEQGPTDSVLLDPENNSRPRRFALFVEPSPFSYISGYKNRF